MLARRVVNGLVWMLLAAGLSAAVAAFGPSTDASGQAAVKAPGHDAAECRPCRADDTRRGQPLPYELDDQSVRSAADDEVVGRG